jgi:opacity protein-like surface antigen
MARYQTASHPPCRILSAALAILAFSLAPPAAAAGAEGPEIALRVGTNGNDYERAGLGLRFGPVWSTDWGNWKASLRPELELNHFRHTGPASGPDSLNQAGAIGLFHVHYGEARFRPYAEVGLGIALFSRDQLGGKEFSTHFQFSQHLAAGVEWAGRWFGGVQASHYSNADIEKPNAGINFYQIVIGAQF